jgi:hypothetical protein
MDVLLVSHVIISLIGIASGLIVMIGLLRGKESAWTGIFLATTVLTSATGFLFPFHGLKPPHILGIISLVVLAIAIAARYAFHLRGAWRWIYVVTAAAALYFNCFVGVVQAFEKDPALRALAPKQTEPPFVIAQLAILVLFITLGVFATTRFRVESPLNQN